MKVQVKDIKGKHIEEINLSDSVFGIKPHVKVLAQYIRVFLTNQRQGTSKTKTRAEVSGGGKKPWKQKGTGRARHGSTRSPIWVHGGVAHGVFPKNWALKLPKKMKELAMKSALSQKASQERIIVLDKVKFDKPHTKGFSKILDDLMLEGKILFVWKEKDENVVKSASNLEGVKHRSLGALNAFDIIDSTNIVFTKDAVLGLDERYSNNETK